MTLTLALPSVVEETLAREAELEGLALDAYALRVLELHVQKPYRSDRAITALKAWRDDAAQRDLEEDVNDILPKLDEDRLSDRLLFPPELKDVTW